MERSLCPFLDHHILCMSCLGKNIDVGQLCQYNFEGVMVHFLGMKGAFIRDCFTSWGIRLPQVSLYDIFSTVQNI